MVSKVSKTGGGIGVSWGAVHKDGSGNLISRQLSVEAPATPTCHKLSCLRKYLRSAIFYTLLVNYHSRRVAYAEANRYKIIPEMYRSGDPSPDTILKALVATFKLACQK